MPGLDNRIRTLYGVVYVKRREEPPQMITVLTGYGEKNQREDTGGVEHFVNVNLLPDEVRERVMAEAKVADRRSLSQIGDAHPDTKKEYAELRDEMGMGPMMLVLSGGKDEEA